MDLDVKVCGITNYEDARLALELGADMLGFIFAHSPRQVTAETAGEIIRQLQQDGLLSDRKTVGVFVNTGVNEMVSVIDRSGIDVVQIHGDEEAAVCNSLPFIWYRALRVAQPEDFDKYCPRGGAGWDCSVLMFEAAVKGVYGGSGVLIRRDTAVYLKNQLAASGKKFMLAGGINADNVLEILEMVKPDIIDASSGLEEKPGKKSVKKMKAFFEKVRAFREGI